MRKVPHRKIMRSLCKTYKNDNGVKWGKVALELMKLPFIQKRLMEIEKERENK